MEAIKKQLAALSERLARLASGNAVIAKPVSIGNRHVVPLCELGMGFGAGGGSGEDKAQRGSGVGGGGGGGAKATPVAVLVVEGNRVRLEVLQS